MHRILVVGLHVSLALSVLIGIAEAQQDGTKFDSKGDTQTYLSLAVEDQQVRDRAWSTCCTTGREHSGEGIWRPDAQRP